MATPGKGRGVVARPTRGSCLALQWQRPAGGVCTQKVTSPLSEEAKSDMRAFGGISIQHAAYIFNAGPLSLSDTLVVRAFSPEASFVSFLGCNLFGRTGSWLRIFVATCRIF